MGVRTSLLETVQEEAKEHESPNKILLQLEKMEEEATPRFPQPHHLASLSDVTNNSPQKLMKVSLGEVTKQSSGDGHFGHCTLGSKIVVWS